MSISVRRNMFSTQNSDVQEHVYLSSQFIKQLFPEHLFIHLTHL